MTELRVKIREIAMPLMLLLLVVLAGEIFMVPILGGITYGGVSLPKLLSVIILFAVVLTFYRISTVVREICNDIAVKTAIYISGKEEPEEKLQKATKATVYGITLLFAYRAIFPYLKVIDPGYAGLFALVVFGTVVAMLLRAGEIFKTEKKETK